MLKQIIDGWRSQQTEQQLYDQFVQMLQMDWEMFEMVLEVLGGRTAPDDIQDELLKRDIEVNRAERSIRRQLVEHLSLQRSASVSSSLVLMSVVKDAERVGDNCKNLLEVAQMLTVAVSDLRHGHEVMEVGKHVTRIFAETIKAFAEEDEDLARDIIQDETLMNKRCDRLVELLARSDLGANEAVCTALWIRFLKRIEAHLSNISSAVVLPVHRIDYRLKYEKRKSVNAEPGTRVQSDEMPTPEEPTDDAK